ncbi:ATP-binding cassette domain-containing protein [Microbacterium sp. MPKO10]|uniref:ATP-binding cassette domain-containing protein n=1 Tax=Microbacterium sp. MPKO10 TaxID=2989818 RepID=UPI002236354F|nr:ATP-binding cassette domain-containing protein [Microbacterium sp. MPKO10]MCW4459637.1 ATP-binding cassette domain-containing protein [Microbacterium sp. MPKO10]
MPSASDAEPALEASDLTVSYPAHGASAEHTAIDGVTFAVGAGEIVGVIGEAGSGKSTLASVLSADFKVSRGKRLGPTIAGGEARLLGTALRGRVSKRRLAELQFRTAYLPQDAAMQLPAEYTVSEILGQPILERDKRFDRAILGRHVATILDAVHMPFSSLDAYPFELSSGQRQRVAIARSLVLGPRVLIADEPTTGIDVLAREALHDLLRSLRDEKGLAALVISHDFALLRHVTSRVIALHKGGLVGLDDIDTLLADRTHPYLSALGSHEEGGTA